ncbi:MAG: response regulator [Hymenobacteraceae bacterium]|nr:response regulator [Hymenobacteraceae bacterium]
MRIFGDSIKTKVVVGFGLALSIVMLAIYLTYSSFTQLLHSVDVLSQPNTKLTKLQHTLATISAAESSIRAYTLTTEEAHFRSYLAHLDTIQGQVDTLQHLMRLNPEELAQVDSMAVLLNAKQESLKRYVALKKEQKNHVYSEKAMRQIASTVEEQPLSTTIKQRTTTTISDRLALKEAQQEAQQQEEQKEQKRGFLSKLFSKKEEKPEQKLPPPVLVPELDVSQEVNVDTSVTATPAAPLAKVRRILHNVQREADQKEQELRAKELALLQQDKQIMDQIRHMMYRLEQHEQEQSELNSAQAREVAQKTSLIMLVIGITGLGSGVAFILVILRDITRSNNYKTKLIRARKEAVQLARAKEAFVANMSHEMRTPLNVILGFTQQMHHTPLQPQQKEHLQAINSAGQHLLHIVNDVLDLSKIEAGKLHINHTTFSLRQLLTEVEQAFVLKAKSKDIHFSCHADAKLPDTLQGDLLRIKQVLFNLIDNAIKFTHQGQVQVAVKQKSKRRHQVVVGIEISDTGIGIPQERIQHVFGEFNQADDSILRRYGGTGLGLSISKKLVEMQGGTLSVSSAYGKGTTFLMVLPLQTAKEEIVQTAPPEAVPLPAAFEGITALVIDDDAYSRTLCNLILSRWGIKVHLANDGQEALDLVQKHSFDVVLTDIQLPGMSGKTVARNIRKVDKQVPIIALTANILSNEHDFFANTAISGHLLKPFTEQELHQKIAEVLPTVPSALPPVTHQEAGPEQQNMEMPYDLSEMRLFTGPDQEMLVAVLEVMLTDQQQNLAQLKTEAEAEKWEAVANTAHKMLTAFKHLQAHTVTPHLEQLEQVLHTGEAENKTLAGAVELAIQHAGQVLEALGQEVAAIKAATTQAVEQR